MREAYFTPGGVSAEAEGLREAIPSVRTSGSFSPQDAALLVLDMQRLFCHPSGRAYLPSAPAIIPGLLRLAASFRSRQRPLFVTRHLDSPPGCGMMERWWSTRIVPEDGDSALLEPFAALHAHHLVKTQYDAFFHTDLEARLKEFGVRQLVVCGVMTHLCCETSARSAFVRGFEVFFPVDGSASGNRDLHRATLLTLGHGFASLPLVGELLAVLAD